MHYTKWCMNNGPVPIIHICYRSMPKYPFCIHNKETLLRYKNISIEYAPFVSKFFLKQIQKVPHIHWLRIGYKVGLKILNMSWCLLHKSKFAIELKETYFSTTDFCTLHSRKSFFSTNVTMYHIFNIYKIITILPITKNKLH